MTLGVMKQRVAEASSPLKGRIVAVFYSLTVLTGLVVFLADGRQALVVDVIAAAFYFAVTVLFYALTRGA
ncbi:MAG TPA: hypothetical protein VJT08_15110 [Terriglobales bacterium]|nr:hypothetical protein [Terriglobales bacterium]